MYSKTLMVAAASLLMVACTTSNEVKKAETTTNTAMTKSVVNGEAVYKASCTKCHTTSVHTRADRTVKSLDSLQKRVAKCNVNVGTNLSDDEVSAVSKHLNTTYYKF